jgi:hypothetical protein
VIATSSEGTRHNTLKQAAIRMFAMVKAGALDDAECLSRLAEAGRSAGLPEVEIKDLLSAAKGIAQPRRLPATVVKAKQRMNACGTAHSLSTETTTVNQDCLAPPKTKIKTKTKIVTQDSKAESCLTPGQSYLTVDVSQSCLTVLNASIQKQIRKHAVSSLTDDIDKSMFLLFRRLKSVSLQSGWTASEWLMILHDWKSQSDELLATRAIHGGSTSAPFKLPELDILWPTFEGILDNNTAVPPLHRQVRSVDTANVTPQRPVKSWQRWERNLTVLSRQSPTHQSDRIRVTTTRAYPSGRGHACSRDT